MIDFSIATCVIPRQQPGVAVVVVVVVLLSTPYSTLRSQGILKRTLVKTSETVMAKPQYYTIQIFVQNVCTEQM